jgi:hypothetical protein
MVTSIQSGFLSGCSDLTTLDLGPLSNTTSIQSGFLSDCTKLRTVIAANNECFLRALNDIPGVEVHVCIHVKSFKEDIGRMHNDKQFLREVLRYLKIRYRKTSKKYLIKEIYSYNKKYNRLPDEKTLGLCRNDIDPISLEELKTIPAERLVLIEEINGTYNGFDVVPLKYLCSEKGYINPLTTNRMFEGDVNKILRVDMRKIKYFM